MTQTIIPGHYHGPDVTVFPEMHVRAADACRADMHEALIWADLGDVAFDQPEVIGRASLHGDVLRLFL